MLTPRISFGCVVDNYGSNIYVLGGSEGPQLPIDACEYYSVELNKWVALPHMNQKRLSASACIFNDSSVFVFGGYDASL